MTVISGAEFMREGMSAIIKTITLVIASTIFGVVIAEIGFRVWLYELQKKNILAFEEIQIEDNSRMSFGNATLAEIIRPTRHPRLIYELKPNLRVNFMGADVLTNQYGFRGQAYQLQKAADKLRVVGLGDSHMFGWGIQNEDSYPYQLGSALNKLTPQCRWEIINTAVPGYNTVMEVETLTAKGLKFSPDLVIIQYVGNDLSLPNFLPRDYWSFRRFYLLYFLYDRLRRHAYGREFLDYTPKVGDHRGFESDPLLVPQQYKDMVGLPSYFRAMRELRELARENHFGLLVFTQFRFPAEIMEVLDELNIEFLEGADAYSKYMKQHEIEKYLGSVLSISATDPHPSHISHRVQAQALADFLQERLIPDDLEKKLACSSMRQELQMSRLTH